jgi:hypothetical protein
MVLVTIPIIIKSIYFILNLNILYYFNLTIFQFILIFNLINFDSQCYLNHLIMKLININHLNHFVINFFNLMTSLIL